MQGEVLRRDAVASSEGQKAVMNGSFTSSMNVRCTWVWRRAEVLRGQISGAARQDHRGGHEQGPVEAAAEHHVRGNSASIAVARNKS